MPKIPRSKLHLEVTPLSGDLPPSSECWCACHCGGEPCKASVKPPLQSMLEAVARPDVINAGYCIYCNTAG